jgi:diaminopimelate decarboxylase
MDMEKLWPLGARRDGRGDLWLGGCAVSALAQTYGTPLYIFDENTLRTHAQAYRAALQRHYQGSSQTAYASKAYLSVALAQLFDEEGLDLDVVSGGELDVARQAGFPAARIHFHGNNKSPAELTHALEVGIGRIVVDNFYELETLAALAARRGGEPARIWLRLSPGIQAHTHAHIQTGHEDTKFGFSIHSGDAERAVAQAMAAPGLDLVGLHSHIGSQIYETDALAAAVTRLMAFAAEMGTQYGFVLAELSPGGGWGVPMVETDPAAPIDAYVAALSAALTDACAATGLALPHLVLEPGRSLVAQAGVAVYTVGARKEVPGIRTYVSVDGGMADNIRPALYGASYTALAIPQGAATVNTEEEVVTLAGRFCESGDVLIRDIRLPRLHPGDLVAIPMAGAYTLAMASNYNLAPRPAVLLVKDGAARVMQRRETLVDLTVRDMPLHGRTSGRARFWKYQALGNDYLVIDPADFPAPPDPDFARRLCDRHLGIGSDGVLWGPLPERSADGAFALRLYNPDGGEFEKSGNGLRIFARYLWDRGFAAGPDFAIDTPGGRVVAHVQDATGDTISMEMGTLTFDSRTIPVRAAPREVVEELVSVGGRQALVTAVGIGNPHCVQFVDEPTSELAHEVGPQLETFEMFPNHTNVQFAHADDPHNLRIEIWERGAGYTLASGTSSCAAAGAAIRTGRCVSPVTVHMPGGTMLVEIAPDWSVRLTGTVAAVCHGEISAALL